MFQLLSHCVTAASRSVSASLPEPCSALAWRVPIAGAEVVALPAEVPRAEPCARDRSEVELAAAELVRSLSALADCSAEPPAYDLTPAVVPAEL